MPRADASTAIRVAIVDDDLAFRKALTRLLVTAGFDVWSCASVDDLLQSHDALERDCLVVDVHLPGPSGIDLQRHLRHRCPDLPIVLLTADPMVVERQSRDQRSVCFEKGIDDATLIATITTLATGARGVDPADSRDTTKVQ